MRLNSRFAKSRTVPWLSTAVSTVWPAQASLGRCAHTTVHTTARRALGFVQTEETDGNSKEDRLFWLGKPSVYLMHHVTYVLVHASRPTYRHTYVGIYIRTYRHTYTIEKGCPGSEASVRHSMCRPLQSDPSVSVACCTNVVCHLYCGCTLGGRSASRGKPLGRSLIAERVVCRPAAALHSHSRLICVC